MSPICITGKKSKRDEILSIMSSRCCPLFAKCLSIRRGPILNHPTFRNMGKPLPTCTLDLLPSRYPHKHGRYSRHHLLPYCQGVARRVGGWIRIYEWNHRSCVFPRSRTSFGTEHEVFRDRRVPFRMNFPQFPRMNTSNKLFTVRFSFC